jgi:hypothetical protein
MAITYNGNVMGKIVITQNEQKFTLEIRQGNCLAVIIHSNKEPDGTFTHTLMQFFADEEHLKRMCKSVDKEEEKAPIFYDVKSIRLNMRYKECATLLKHLVKYYKITCYYK